MSTVTSGQVAGGGSSGRKSGRFRVKPGLRVVGLTVASFAAVLGLGPSWPSR